MTDVQSRPLTASQRQALAKMPELADSRFPEVRDSLPAANYVDPVRFDREIRGVFRNDPVLIGPAALLSDAGVYFARDVAGMPVLVTRARSGEVRAFANVCRHRGARLCTVADTVKSAKIVCPYHAWTYSLEGEAVGIPRQETFPGLDKTHFHLAPLPCVESGGLIWARLDPKGSGDFAQVQGEVGADLDAIGLGGMHVFDRTTFPVKANWKLVMDTMLDSYHVTRLHKDSLARFFVDAENIIDRIGPHVRAAAARGNFRRDQISGDFGAARQIMVFAYTLFPNGIVVVSPDFVSVAVLKPIATDRTDVDYYMLADAPPADERAEGKLRRSFELMRRAFGEEDYWAAELCDQGLRSGTLDQVTLGGMEVQISLFHQVVQQRLDGLEARA